MAEAECGLCHKHLEGDAYRWQDYVGKVTQKPPLGLQCQHCGTVYCNRTHQKALNFSLWAGWEKSVCLHCGQPFGPGKILLPAGVALKDAAPVPLFDLEPAGDVPSGADAVLPSLPVANVTAASCPTCAAPFPADGDSYCPDCGYEYATGQQGIGPATFAFPPIRMAYTPGNRYTSAGLLRMALYALGAGVIGGMLVEGGDLIISLFAGMSDSGLALVMIVAALVGYVFVAGGVGTLIGRAVSRGSISGRSSHPEMAAGVAAVGGLVAFLVFVMLRGIVQAPEGVDSPVDLLKLGIFLVGLAGAAAYTARQIMRTTPFCADCGQVMKKIALKPLPGRLEERVMAAVQAGAYADVAQAAGTLAQNAGNTLNITVWVCEACQKRGFLNIEKTQTRTVVHNSAAKQQIDTRLIYSAAAEEAAMKALRGVAARF